MAKLESWVISEMASSGITDIITFCNVYGYNIGDLYTEDDDDDDDDDDY